MLKENNHYIIQSDLYCCISKSKTDSSPNIMLKFVELPSLIDQVNDKLLLKKNHHRALGFNCFYIITIQVSVAPIIPNHD